jgi:hypothetical protein
MSKKVEYTEELQEATAKLAGVEATLCQLVEQVEEVEHDYGDYFENSDLTSIVKELEVLAEEVKEAVRSAE